MNIPTKRFAAMALSAAVILTGLAPAQAMPVVPVAPAAVASTDIVSVGHRRPPPVYYHGHRGYRERRPGYRYHNGYWFPLAAFAAGAIIGGAIAQPAPPTRAYRAPGAINPRHYQWCEARYRSYDRYSNTFQPYHGPRQQCYSPYY